MCCPHCRNSFFIYFLCSNRFHYYIMKHMPLFFIRSILFSTALHSHEHWMCLSSWHFFQWHNFQCVSSPLLIIKGTCWPQLEGSMFHVAFVLGCSCHTASVQGAWPYWNQVPSVFPSWDWEGQSITILHSWYLSKFLLSHLIETRFLLAVFHVVSPHV